jgi:uncharacterized membrane-anchored protein YjiN (DUF445 family)
MSEPFLPSDAPLISDVAEKRARLRRAKTMATALLAFAVVVLVIARLYPEPSYIAALIRSAAEAAIVGGLADWFAVTALFRRPLGLPIPHTALIPARKDEIGQSLGHFVSEQFLAPELLVARLRQRNRAQQVAGWLAMPEVARFIADRLVTLVPMLLSGTNDAELRQFFANVANEGLKRLDLRPALDAVLEALVRRGRHMVFADAVMELIAPTIISLREALIVRIGTRTGRFFPRYFDRKIAEEMIQGILAWLDEARTPGTEERAHLDAWLQAYIQTIRSAPDFAALVARAQAALVSHPALTKSFGAIWDELKAELLADAARPDPRLGSIAAQIVQTAGRLLQDSSAVQGHFNTAIENALVSTLAPWRRGIGAYIAEIVASWDAGKVADLIELQVGRDLQYIRVNGTLVGALIGSGLYVIGSALPVLRRMVAGAF